MPRRRTAHTVALLGLSVMTALLFATACARPFHKTGNECTKPLSEPVGERPKAHMNDPAEQEACKAPGKSAEEPPASRGEMSEGNPGCAAEPQNRSEPGAHIGSRQEADLERWGQLLELDLVHEVKKDEVIGSTSPGFQTRRIETKRGDVVEFDLATGALAVFWPWQSFEYLGRREPVARLAALGTASSFLERVGVDIELSEEHSSYYDHATGRDKDLLDCFWRFSERYKYQDVPFFDCAVLIEVSAYSGAVTNFINHPVRDLPESMQVLVSREAALAEALAQADRSFPDCGYKVEGGPDKMIAFPNRSLGASRRSDSPTTERPRLSWVVWLVPRQGGGLLVEIVDAVTGRVIREDGG